jgi:Zn-dependent M28 family amino/carboxypeptidase
MGLEPAGESGTYFQRYPYTVRGPNPRTGAQAGQQTTPPNVIAVVRGSDPALRDEYVVLSAHFDHVGIGRAVGGDSIYNGADDNASGTAALLEIAKAFSNSPERPRRSIMFLHVSGEEKGLLGSRWFSDHPTVPVRQIVANFNVDMIGRNSPDSIAVIGKKYSTLGSLVDRTAVSHPELGLTVTDDLWPGQQFFFRSDHFNFARVEIPALFFFAGEHDDYHEASDHADKIDADKAARVARLIYYSVQAVANDPQKPTWDPRGLAEVKSMSR